MRLAFTLPVLLLLLILSSWVPAASAQADVVVVGDHVLSILKSDKDSPAVVTETIHYTNTGDVAFDGALTFDLVPAAMITGYNLVDVGGGSVGDAGQIRSDPLPNETVAGLTRYTYDLAAHGVAFAPDATYRFVLRYQLPGDLRVFERGFTMPTPRLTALVSDVQGLAPVSEATPFVSVSRTWSFTLAPGEEGPFAPGQRISFTWTDTPVPLSPLVVTVEAQRGDQLRLVAEASGGIEPYTVTWDLDGDGVCDDFEGATVLPEVAEVGVHRIKACVTDSALPAGSAESGFQARTLEGTTTTAGPTGWALGAAGLAVGALLIYGLTQAGILRAGGSRPSGAAASGKPSIAAEGRQMLELRQRVMVAGLKELELAKKKGEIEDGLYTPLKAELKQDTVRVMRELEKRKDETI